MTVTVWLASLAPVAKGRARPCREWTPYERKKPGRFEEQPMPETTKIRCGGSWRSEQAWKSAFRTPKSPHPGHQSGGTSDLKSFMVGGAVVVDMSDSFKAPWT